MDALIRSFTAGDIECAVAQALREGWTPSRAWFEVFLAHDPVGAFVLEAGGRPVGMVTATCFADTAWVGYLIVSPEVRRRGLGTSLMSRALEHVAAAGIRTVRLDADPPGINIYRRLGFVDEYESLRFSLDSPGAYPPTSATPLTLERLDEVARLDRAAFGDDRGRLLRLLLPRAEAGFIVERGGAVAGYVLVIATAAGVHIGPCVADDSSVARELWGASLRAARGRRVTMGIGAPNRAGFELLRSLGFVSRPSSVRMIRGPVAAAGTVERIFAIGSGAFG